MKGIATENDSPVRALTRRFADEGEVRAELENNLRGGTLWVPLAEGDATGARAAVEVTLVLPDGGVLDGLKGTVSCIVPGGVVVGLEALPEHVIAALEPIGASGRAAPARAEPAAAEPAAAEAATAEPATVPAMAVVTPAPESRPSSADLPGSTPFADGADDDQDVTQRSIPAATVPAPAAATGPGGLGAPAIPEDPTEPPPFFIPDGVVDADATRPSIRAASSGIAEVADALAPGFSTPAASNAGEGSATPVPNGTPPHEETHALEEASGGTDLDFTTKIPAAKMHADASHDIPRPGDSDPVPSLLASDRSAWEEPAETDWEIGLPAEKVPAVTAPPEGAAPEAGTDERGADPEAGPSPSATAPGSPSEPPVIEPGPPRLTVQFKSTLDLKLVWDAEISAGRLTVTTTEARAEGEHVDVRLVLPGGAEREVTGTVTSQLSTGMLVTLDPLDEQTSDAIRAAAQPELAAAVAAVAAAPVTFAQASTARHELVMPFAALGDFKREFETNIRKGGVLVPTSDVPPLRARVQVVFSLMGGKREVRLEGECVFHTPGGAGVQLAAIPPETQREIDALLAAASVVPRAPDPTPEPSRAAPATPAVVVTPPPPPPVASPNAAAAATPADRDPLQDVPALDTPKNPAPRPRRPTPTLAPAGQPFEGDLVEVLREAEVEGEARVEGQVGGSASWLKVLANLQTERATGILSVERGGETKRFLFYQGRPVDSIGDPPRHDESLLSVVRKHQLLKPGPFRVLERAVDGAEEEFEAVAKCGIWNAEEHDRARRWQLLERCADVFAWERGRYRFDPEGDRSWARPTRGVLVGHIILHGVRSYIRASGEDLSRIMRPALDRALVIVPDTGFEPGKLGMSDKELRFWADIDGKKSLRSLVQVSPLGGAQTYQVVFALCRLGVLAFAGAPAPKAPEDPAAGMKAKLADMKTRDPFARLGLSWMASGPQIRQAWDRMREELAATVRQGGPSAEPARAMLVLGEEAYGQIADERPRRLMRLKLIEDPDRIEASAAMLAEKADILHLRGDVAGAKTTIQMALDLSPGNEAFRKLASKFEAAR